jgi:DNA-binding transcriptional MerR regulator
MPDARQLCPAVIPVQANHRLYTEYHERILKAVDTCLPVEKVCSIDEMACRLMGTERRVPVARELALKVKRALREQARKVDTRVRSAEIPDISAGPVGANHDPVSRVRSRLAAGGNRIRTTGPSHWWRLRIVCDATERVSCVGTRLSQRRDRRFESCLLQRRVTNEPLQLLASSAIVAAAFELPGGVHGRLKFFVRARFLVNSNRGSHARNRTPFGMLGMDRAGTFGAEEHNRNEQADR